MAICRVMMALLRSGTRHRILSGKRSPDPAVELRFPNPRPTGEKGSPESLPRGSRAIARLSRADYLEGL
jgi:hypothetical protein